MRKMKKEDCVYEEIQRPRYIRNKNRIEILVTYQCNRRCYNCNTMVRQAQSSEFMTEEQINKFIKESIENKVKWENIRILGGEPTIHLTIQRIVEMLMEYKKQFSKNTIITIVSNGTGKYVRGKLEELKSNFDVVIENSNKVSNIQPSFWPVNNAPIDTVQCQELDYSKGCWMTTMCGIALDLNGYYPCSTAAAIARVTGEDFGRKSLPTKEDDMKDLYNRYCPLCGH